MLYAKINVKSNHFLFLTSLESPLHKGGSEGVWKYRWLLLEDHLVMIPMEPRRPGCSVVEGKDITPEKVKALADAADVCWKAILAHDLDAFAAAYRASFEAQIAMFPGMVNPSVNGVIEPEASVQPMIDRYSNMEEVLAWKMPGAGGGGYLALVVKDSLKFAENHDEAIHLQIRRA